MVSPRTGENLHVYPTSKNLLISSSNSEERKKQVALALAVHYLLPFPISSSQELLFANKEVGYGHHFR